MVGAEQTHTKSVLDAHRCERSVRKRKRVHKIWSPVNNWITRTRYKYKSPQMKQKSSKIYPNKEDILQLCQLALICLKATEGRGESITINITFLLHFLLCLFIFLSSSTPSALDTTSQTMRGAGLSLRHKRVGFFCKLIVCSIRVGCKRYNCWKATEPWRLPNPGVS